MKAAVLVGALASLLWTGAAVACTCVGISVEEMNKQPVIVRGWVTAVRDSSKESGGWTTPLKIIELDVSHVWRGSIENGRIRVVTPGQASMCGFPFQIGGDYLVYAGFVDGMPWTSTCSGTARWQGQDMLHGSPSEAVLADTSLSHHWTPGVWFMLLSVECSNYYGMEAEITDPTGEVLCPLRVGKSGAAQVANRCDCFSMSLTPRRKGGSGSSLVRATCWQPHGGPYRIRVRGLLAPSVVSVRAGAMFSRMTHWGPGDTLTVEPGDEISWSVEWKDVAAGDSTRVRLERSTNGNTGPARDR